MKGVRNAFVLGGTVSAFLYLTATWGLTVGFRVRDWIERRREAAMAQERNF